jgi:hypothetical protein
VTEGVRKADDVREQFLVDLRAVQTGWHAAEVSTGAVEPEPATEGQMASRQVAKAGRAIVADYLAAAPVGSGGTIRQQYPQPGELRNAAFKAAKADCVARLAELGLTHPMGLPISVARSLDEAERFFLAGKVTAPAEDMVAAGVTGIDDTVAAGVALVDDFWDASAQARVDHPEKGADRNAAFKAAHALMSEGLTALGLPVKATQALPASRPRAMIEAERRFREFLAAEGPARPPRRRWLHKPLLLLVCFGRCAHQEGRMVRFAEIEEELTELLLLYDPPGSSASEPFWRLQYDGSLWVLEGQKLDELRASASPPTATRLRDHLVSGGLSKPYYDAVVLDRSLLSEAVNVVITTFLPEAKWEQIRDHFGFSNPVVPPPVVEPGMTIELAMEESERAFRSCQRHAPEGQERNECFAAQAQVFLARLEALGAIHNREVVVSPEEVGAARHKKLVDYVRMAGKNIELAERRYGWSPPGDRP